MWNIFDSEYHKSEVFFLVNCIQVVPELAPHRKGGYAVINEYQKMRLPP